MCSMRKPLGRVGDLADQIEGEVAYHRHVFGTVTGAQA
jgi:hypothetical protein